MVRPAAIASDVHDRRALLDSVAPPRVEQRKPGVLRTHPDRPDVGAVSRADEYKLIISLKSKGQFTPVAVTGLGCHSEPDTILDGHRRREAAMKLDLHTVSVHVYDNLTQDDERLLADVAQVAARTHATLSTMVMADLVRRLDARYMQRTGVRQGTRTDLVGTSGPKPLKRESSARHTAVALNVSESSVYDLRAVAGAGETLPELAAQVDSKELTLREAASRARAAKRIKNKGATAKPPLGGLLEGTNEAIASVHAVSSPLSEFDSWLSSATENFAREIVLRSNALPRRYQEAAIPLVEALADTIATWAELLNDPSEDADAD